MLTEQYRVGRPGPSRDGVLEFPNAGAWSFLIKWPHLPMLGIAPGSHTWRGPGKQRVLLAVLAHLSGWPKLPLPCLDHPFTNLPRHCVIIVTLHLPLFTRLARVRIPVESPLHHPIPLSVNPTGTKNIWSAYVARFSCL